MYINDKLALTGLGFLLDEELIPELLDDVDLEHTDIPAAPLE